MRRVPVMLPYPFPGPFDYSVPPDLDPQAGDVVLVPLNRREEVGEPGVELRHALLGNGDRDLLVGHQTSVVPAG